MNCLFLERQYRYLVTDDVDRLELEDFRFKITSKL